MHLLFSMAFKCDLNLNHLEVHFGYAAIGASPIFRNIFPFGACRNAILRPAFSFIINPATNDTLVLLHFNLQNDAALMQHDPRLSLGQHV